MAELLPWLQRKRTRIINLKTVDEQAVPEKPGAYIILSENSPFPYPRRKSRVYYIGQGANLRRRVLEHKDYTLRAMRKPSYNWREIYRYSRKHGCKVCWVVCRGKESPKDLEKELLEHFQHCCGARPKANGTSS